MIDFRFHLGISYHGIDSARFVLVGQVFSEYPDQVMVIADSVTDNCTLEMIERENKSNLEVFLKNIPYDSTGESSRYSFHILFSSKGKLYKQTLNRYKENDLSYPKEIEFR